MSSPVSRGFRHLRRPSAGEEGRVPPGQYATHWLPGAVGRARRISRCRTEPSMAARPVCSCRTCTSGRARSGCAAWSCSITTNLVSGKPAATTSTETPWREQRYAGD
jgi:hypothetical protein